MKLFDRVVNNLEERRERVLSGKINCIPCPFPRFSQEWPGIEQGKYYGITAVSKAAKSKFTNFMFLFKPLFYAIDNPDKLRLKIFYFSLEISEEDLYHQLICHLLFVLSKGQYRYSPKDLKSVDSSKPINSEVLEIIKSDEYKKYFEFFEENVRIISAVRNPTGINKIMKDYAKKHGIQHKKIINFINNDTGESTPTEVDDWYEPNDPDEYVMCIVDHISLIQTESYNGKALNLHESIVKLSSEYFVNLRNKYRYIPVVVQQQAVGSEGVENIKLGKLKPSVADMGDCKLTIRDFNTLFGIFSPFKHDLKEYMAYDISKFRDNIRFMEIIISRDGGGGTTCPLYFDGCCDFFKELPLPYETDKLKPVYAMIENINQKPKIAMHIANINNNLKKEDNNVEDFSISKFWFWKNYKYWKYTRTWYKGIKSKRNVFNTSKR